MKKYKREILWSVILITFSFLIYFIEYLMSGNVKNVLRELVSQLAFLPLYLLIATILFEALLQSRAKEEMLRKNNTIIGLFFSEIGKELLKSLIQYDVNISAIKENFRNNEDWTTKKCVRIKGLVENYESDIRCTKQEFEHIREILSNNKKILVQFMNNPNLIEHESFTELLLAVFHLMEELKLRVTTEKIKKEDYEHLVLDGQRAFKALMTEWVLYMGHLKKEYPFLYSLEVRTNPFI